jgi:hypothetical protein
MTREPRNEEAMTAPRSPLEAAARAMALHDGVSWDAVNDTCRDSYLGLARVGLPAAVGALTETELFQLGNVFESDSDFDLSRAALLAVLLGDSDRG